MSTRPRPASDNVSVRLAQARGRQLPWGLIAIASLLLGIGGGLYRIGWPWPGGSDLALRHGGIMVVGFMGTVIAIERALALGHPLATIAPAASAGAGLSLLLGGPDTLSVLLAGTAALTYTIALAVLWRRQPQVGAALLAAGGGALTLGALVWGIDGNYARILPWWMTFFVLTIAGERLELTRFQRMGRASLLLGFGAFATVVAGAAAVLASVVAGNVVLGIGFVLVASWSAWRDPVRRGIRGVGVPQFAAVGLLTAYGWLVVSGALLVLTPLTTGIYARDAWIHAFFTGFVFSAVIAHEPIIAQVVTGIPFQFSRLMYAPLVLLGSGLAVRIGADLIAAEQPRRWAALLQAVAIVLLMALSARSLLLGRRLAASPRAGAHTH